MGKILIPIFASVFLLSILDQTINISLGSILHLVPIVMVQTQIQALHPFEPSMEIGTKPTITQK